MKNLYKKINIKMFLILWTFSSVVNAANITVVVKNVQTITGAIQMKLENKEAYQAKKNKNSIYRAVKVVKGKSLRFVITDVAVGEYSISLFHDTNNNGELDTNLFGIPSEGYAFSNNAQGSMGKPDFSDAKFTVTDTDKVLDIKLEY